MRQSETNIRLDRDSAVIVFGNQFTITIEEGGYMGIGNAEGKELRYRPTRLENPAKVDNQSILPVGERMESEQVIRVEDNLMLELRTSRIDNHLKAEVLFRIIADGESLFAGVFAEWVDGDWVIGFRRMDDFLTLVDKVFRL